MESMRSGHGFFLAFFAASLRVVAGVHAAVPPANVMSELGTIMAAGKRNLARAEAHHKKAMEKAHTQLSLVFTQETDALAKAISLYGTAMESVAKEYEQAAAFATEGMARMPESISTNGWEDAAVEAKAKLGVEVEALVREAGHVRRQRARSLQEMKEQAIAPMEDAASTLSRKLGDLSSDLDAAQGKLDQAVSELDVDTGADAATKTSKNQNASLPLHAAAAGGKAQETNYANLEKTLAAARNATTLHIALAEKQLAAVLKEAQTKTTQETAKIKAGLEAAEQVELKPLRAKLTAKGHAKPAAKGLSADHSLRGGAQPQKKQLKK